MQLRNGMMAFLTVAALAAPVRAGGPSTWSFDETTTGGNVFWRSPTPIETCAPLYAASYELTQILIGVSILGEVDVTGLVPPELLVASGVSAGPAPVVLFNEPFAFPEPPARPALSARLRIAVDVNGFVTLRATDVVLGTYDIGVEVSIDSLRVAGTVTVEPAGNCAEDLDCDGLVGFTDLVMLLGAWGPCPGCREDVGGNGTVGFGDLSTLLAGWGVCN